MYPVVVAGALSFELLRFAQIPLQLWYMKHIYVSLSGIGVPGMLAAAGTALISGIVQEAFKGTITAARFYSLKDRQANLTGIGIGALTGAGFGIYEACTLTGVPYALGILGTVAVIERAITIVFHTATGAIAGYGFVTRRPVRFVLVAMLIHGIINYLIFPLQKGALSVELFYVTIGAMTAAAFVWMLVRSVERHTRPG